MYLSRSYVHVVIYAAGVWIMGRIERKGASGFTKYIWYPGNLDDWKRAAISLGAGLAVGLTIGVMFGGALWGVVAGTSVTAAITGLSFGQRDAKALPSFKTLKTPETGRALWRAIAKGFGTAAAAVLVAHVTPGNGIASWTLPLVPAVVAALAHQFGMMQVRMAEEAAAKREKQKAAFPKVAAA